MSKYLKVAERVAWTFVQAFGAVILVEGEFTLMALEAAAVAGGLAAVKCIVGLRVGDREEPSVP